MWALCKLKCDLLLLLSVALCVVRSFGMCDCRLGVNRTAIYCSYFVLSCVVISVDMFYYGLAVI